MIALQGLEHVIFEPLVKEALREDFAQRGDVTSEIFLSSNLRCKAVIRARQSGVIAGLNIAEYVWRVLSENVVVTRCFSDGSKVLAGDVILTIEGYARTIFAGERTALNFLCHMSGIATQTRAFVDMIAHTKARLTCTRKTLPGLRAIEKYAVHVGGGSNHRFGLHDAVLIKDNHIAAVGGLSAVIARTREYQKLHMLRLAIEVESCEQFCLVKDSHLFDHVLLDNMCCDEMKDSVASNDGVLTLEATGGVCIDNIIAIADTGVDYISAGFLTHSASYLDLGLDVE